MNILVIFALLVLILAGASVVVILSFTKYRYSGDLTPVFVIGFVILFIATILFALALIDPSAVNF